MQIDPRTTRRLEQAAHRFQRIDGQFADFRRSLAWLQTDRCPVRGVTVEADEEPRCVTVSFGTVSILLRLLLVLPAGGPAAGQVTCTRTRPRYDVVDPVIASFTFDAQGRTSFEFPVNGDVIELESQGPDIVLHLLEMAAQPIDFLIASTAPPARG